ncbi:MAG: hypothetical protein HYR75_07980, partial [Gemmatimonadetes bacterium]|nr:hypothetical protein [Gemmatimonadota bacterium]
TGFIVAPQAAAWYGNPGGLRLFVDGVALDAVNPRNGGIPDLTTIPIWSLEDVTVERAAGEIRVYMRTWRVERTTPSTRTDVMTGSENLNFYRGFFGKRFDNGVAFQLAGQQLSTTSRTGASGDGLGAFGRLGWARGAWTVDVTALHQGINRGAATRYPNSDAPVLNAMPALIGSEGVAYARIAWHDPQKDPLWVQFSAASINSEGKDSTATSSTAGGAFGGLGGIGGTTTTDTTAGADTLASRTEYTVSAGFTRWGVRFATFDRMRSVHGAALFSPGARVDYDWKIFSVGASYDRSPDASDYLGSTRDSSLSVKRNTADSTKADTSWLVRKTDHWRTDQTTHTDAFARITPWSWLQLGAAWSRVAPEASTGLQPTLSTRLEGAIRWRDRWISGGMISRGVSALVPPIELDTALRKIVEGQVTGITGGFHGPLLFGWNLDLQGVKWQTAGWYRPQTELRTTISFSSAFLNKFPRNNFHLLVAGTHEYRGQFFVPADSATRSAAQPGYSMIGALLEIRIGDATITYQVRNPIGVVYASYPGWVMPRIVNLYGVRWAFWN